MPNNLIVKTNCLVTRVLFDSDNNATGVEYLEGWVPRMALAQIEPAD